MKTFFISGAILFVTGWVFSQTQTFTTPGMNSFVVPSGVLSVKVECIGGGGAGGRVTPANIFDNDAAGGGGGGAYAMGLVNVIAGNSYTLQVGDGGINDGNSVHGGNSYFDAGQEVFAEGGRTRTGNDNESGAIGGQAGNSLGTVKFSGGVGGNGDEGDSNGGGGGGAAGYLGDGFPGSELTGGAGQGNYGGYGGPGGPDGAHGDAGGNYGGGGGGSSCNGSNDRDGGAGASGIVIINWIEVQSFSPDQICSGSGSLEITGTNFSGIDSVTVGGVSVPFTLNSVSSIQLDVSGLTSGGYIIVYSQNGSSVSANELIVVSQSLMVDVDSYGVLLTAQYTGGAGETYQWYDCINGNAPISGATSATYAAVSNGLYAVEVTENGCTISSGCIAVSSVGLEELTTSLVSLYPNPSSDMFYVLSDELIETFTIYDVKGIKIEELSVNGSKMKVSAQELASGTYFIQIQLQGDVSEMIRFVKR